MQVLAEQFPAESQLQFATPAGQAQAVVVGALTAVGEVPPPVVTPTPHPHPKQFWAHWSPLGQSASVVQADLAGAQVQGPPQGSVPAQEITSPGRQVGFVQPHVAGIAGALAVAPVVVDPQGHW